MLGRALYRRISFVRISVTAQDKPLQRKKAIVGSLLCAIGSPNGAYGSYLQQAQGPTSRRYNYTIPQGSPWARLRLSQQSTGYQPYGFAFGNPTPPYGNSYGDWILRPKLVRRRVRNAHQQRLVWSQEASTC